MTIVANLKHAARNGQSVEIGGGVFGPAELAAAAQAIEAAQALLDALDSQLPHAIKHVAAGERFNLREALNRGEQP